MEFWIFFFYLKIICNFPGEITRATSTRGYDYSLFSVVSAWCKISRQPNFHYCCISWYIVARKINRKFSIFLNIIIIYVLFVFPLESDFLRTPRDSKRIQRAGLTISVWVFLMGENTPKSHVYRNCFLMERENVMISLIDIDSWEGPPRFD